MARISKFLKNNRQFILFILLMSVFRSAVADWYTVPSGSMQPTIKIGDRVMVNKMAYDLRLPFTNIMLFSMNEPQRGEIIVFESKLAKNRLIKRVVGLPGDRVSMRDEVLTIFGVEQVYSIKNREKNQLIRFETLAEIKHVIKIEQSLSSQMSSFSSVIVPKDHYLVLGDNRRNSADSRVYGFVPRHELRGKATNVAFSLNYDNYYIPRSERFFTSLYN